MIISVDFDNTLAVDGFPYVGKTVPHAIASIKELFKHHTLILFTCREGAELECAKQFLKDEGIYHCFDAFNEWPRSEQIAWGSNPRKIVGTLNVDDKNVGCPLIKLDSGEYVVNWPMVIDLIHLQCLTGNPVCGTRED